MEKTPEPAFDPYRAPKHWTARRKRQVLEAIDDGRITEAEARAVHNISAEEMTEWRRVARKGG